MLNVPISQAPARPGPAARTRFARLLATLLAWLLLAGTALAQTCGTNETRVTFNFGTAASTSATGGTGTWTTGSTGPIAWPVGAATSGTANTLTFQLDKSAGATWVDENGTTGAAAAPKQYTLGNLANSLMLAMDVTVPGEWTGMTVSFARPMSRVRFVMGDVDYGGFQDQLEVTGYLGGVAVTAPVLTPVNPGNYTTTTLGGITAQVTRTNTNGCNQTSTACNVQIDFSQPIDSLRLRFLAGPAIAAPSLQYVGFDDFSFCEPIRADLKLVKTASASPLLAGQTASYTLVATNVGGTPTSGVYTVTDVIGTAGVSFPTPLAPGGGWACSVGTTTLAADTATCGRSTALGVNGSAPLTLTVALSPDATATAVVNRAKTWGGNDPNKSTLTATGSVTGCSAASEGLNGGGANAGCAFEDTPLARQAYLSVTKTNGTGTVVTGATTGYTVTLTNTGPASAGGALLKETPSAGLRCDTVTCAATSGGAACPVGLPAGTAIAWSAIPNLWNGTGLTVPVLPAGGSVSLSLGCTVTASGS